MSFIGFGEIGLPPKKPFCYLADLKDIQKYLCAFNAKLQEVSSSEIMLLDQYWYYDPFSNFPQDLFPSLRNKMNEKGSRDAQNEEIGGGCSLYLENVIRLLFRILDLECSLNNQEFSRTAQSGLDVALLDIWSKIESIPLYTMIHPLFSIESKPSFYTASLQNEISKILQIALNARNYTPYLKIKLDENIEKGSTILNELYKALNTFEIDKKWALDANAAWSSEVAMQYLRVISPYKECIYMLEQPFPLEFTEFAENEKQKWRQVKKAYEQLGIYIYADESVSTENDIPKLMQFIHGVNIKLEKAGGIRGALKTIHCAKQNGLKVWIGMMVASNLNSNSAASLFPFTDNGGDLDGGLLIEEDSQWFEGGFTWGQNGHILLSQTIGIGVNLKASKVELFKEEDIC